MNYLKPMFILMLGLFFTTNFAFAAEAATQASPIMYYFEMILTALGSTTLLATIIAKLTPTTKDDIIVNNTRAKISKYVSWLPIASKSRYFKELEGMAKELQGKSDK